MRQSNLQTSAFQAGQTATSFPFSRNAGVFNLHRVIVNGDRSNWNNTLKQRFDELTALPEGWDGYRGRPVSFACAQFAALVLERLCLSRVPAPALVPGSDGTVQIEWHLNGYDVELDVLGANRVVAYRYEIDTAIEEEIELENDFTVVMEWLHDLYGNANEAGAAR